jgi:hypothetical protein
MSACGLFGDAGSLLENGRFSLTRSRHVQTGSGADALAAAFQGRHTRTAGFGEGMQFTRGEEDFHGLGQPQMDTDQH